MADTIREQIIKAMVTQLESATFETLLGATIYRGQLLFQTEIEALPIVAVIPREEEAGVTQYGSAIMLMPVVVGAILAIEGENPSELAEAVHGELIAHAMGLSSALFQDMVYVGGGIEQYPDQLGQPLISVSITINIEYLADIGDPYNQTN